MWQGGDSFEQRRFDARLRHLGFIFFIALFALVARLFVLQIVKGRYYAKISESNRTQLFFQRAPRGIIYDRLGRAIVDNVPKVAVLFSPLNLNKELIADVVVGLSGILNVSEEELWSVIRKKGKESAVVRVAEDIPRQTVFKLEESRLHLPGVSLNLEPKRRYSSDNLASHVIGYLGEIDRGELREMMQDGYQMGDIVGKIGVEKVYDSFLKGNDGGFQLEVDAAGRSSRILYQIDTHQGSDVYLCVDKNVQKAMENAFSKRGFTGAGVAIDPNNGRILALCSFPNFDPNLFVSSREEVTDIIYDEESKPLFNRAIQGEYPPGSIFKIITSAAICEQEGFDFEKKINCAGVFHLGGSRGRSFKCWKEKGHGKVNFIRAVAESCDVYFYTVSIECGLEPILEVASDFNLGALSGIDIPGEKKGFLPSASWKKRVFKQSWYKGDTVNISIGQGFLTMTPLQACVMISAVANRGMVWRPYILDKIMNENEEVIYKNEPYLINRVRFMDTTWDLIDTALKEAVNSGTGVACRVNGLEVAGKTGTAQNPHGEDHAWFVSYASLPGAEPEIAVSILVAHGEHGASAAAPIAREVICEHFKDRIKK